jgi:hypothetical protein
MDYQNRPQGDLFTTGQQSLPNATTILVLGILSIVLCFVCGIIALVIASGDRRLYHQNPGLYTTSSYDLIKAGRICSIISLCLWGGIILFYLFFIVIALSFSSHANF